MRIGVTYENGEIFSILDIQSSLSFMMLKTERLNRHRL